MGAVAIEPVNSEALSTASPATVSLMGLDVAAVSERETIAHVLGALAQSRGGWICTANVDVLRQWRRSPEVRGLVAGTDLVVADGMPLIWASRLSGTPLPERVAGSTLTFTLTEAAAKAGASVFLLGGNTGIAEAAGRRLSELYPGVRIAGTLCPPLGFEQQPGWAERIVEALVTAKPDIVFVALGCPKQERLIATLRTALPGAWFIGCGISLSFVAGETPRAPALMQKLGLEWLHRLGHEPRRLARRYLVDGLPFAFELLSVVLLARLRAQLFSATRARTALLKR